MNLKDIPFAKLLDISESNSEFLFELSDDEKYTNHLGTVAAAAQFSLAEFASGQWMLNSFPDIATQVIPVLRKSDVKFRKPAIGRVRARAIVNEDTRHQFISELMQRNRALLKVLIELVNDDSEVVMSGTYEWFIQLQTPRNISNN
jgi:acyl-coenzyme A thioesterase PaaI-like protein